LYLQEIVNDSDDDSDDAHVAGQAEGESSDDGQSVDQVEFGNILWPNGKTFNFAIICADVDLLNQMIHELNIDEENVDLHQLDEHLVDADNGFECTRCPYVTRTSSK
jgi:hypothetical protein